MIQWSSSTSGKQCTGQYLSIDNGGRCHHFFFNLCMSLTSVKVIPFQAESRRVMLKTTVRFVFLAYFS